MADLIYIVRIKHKDKGIGYMARAALQNSQRQESSPIKRTRFSQRPNGKRTGIEVLIDDAPLRNIITEAINSSGRMPTDKNLFYVKDVQFQRGKGSCIERRLEELQSEYEDALCRLKDLRDENEALQQRSMSQQIPEVKTPLDGLLMYFKSADYMPETILDDPYDIGFAKRVFLGELENSFKDYVCHLLGKDLSLAEIEAALNYKPDPGRMSSLLQKYEAARKELDFLGKLKSGETDIPETLVPDYIRLIEEKDHNKAIEEYESALHEEKVLASMQKALEGSRDRFDMVSEHIDLLAQAGEEIPVVFNCAKDCIELYLPFSAGSLEDGFLESLRRDVEERFAEAEVEPLDSAFTAYRVMHPKGPSFLSRDAGRLIKDPPITLRIAGFNRIAPYWLGQMPD